MLIENKVPDLWVFVGFLGLNFIVIFSSHQKPTKGFREIFSLTQSMTNICKLWGITPTPET